MESALIVAIIAAGTSIISIIATLFAAKKSRDSGRELLLVKAEVDSSADRAHLFRGIEVESERLRVRCWEMVGCLSVSPSASDPDEFRSIVSRFQDQATLFLDRWADAKPEVPEPLIQYVRAIRHACRTHILVIRRSCLERNETSTIRLLNRLHILLDQLEHFEFVIATVRRSKSAAEYNLILQSLPSLGALGAGDSRQIIPGFLSRDTFQGSDQEE